MRKATSLKDKPKFVPGSDRGSSVRKVKGSPQALKALARCPECGHPQTQLTSDGWLYCPRCLELLSD